MQFIRSLVRISMQFALATAVTISTFTYTFAHERVEGGAMPSFSKGQISLRTTLLGFSLLLLLLFISMLLQRPKEWVKRVLFWSMTIVIVTTTLVLAGLTVYVNQNSWSKGPVHWHADFQLWACGSQLDLKDPQGWSNKVGSSELHEHNDFRIHYEGVVMAERDAYLGNFFTVIGGDLHADLVSVPTNEGVVTYTNGDMCDNGLPGEVQVFVYRVNEDQTYSQTKLNDPERYLMSHQSQVPPGDCIIVEFGLAASRTEHLCESYRAAELTGKLKGERL